VWDRVLVFHASQDKIMRVEAHTESRQRYSVDADNKGCLAVMVTTDVTATQCPAVVPVLYLELMLKL
jgi:hypothetical protein